MGTGRFKTRDFVLTRCKLYYFKDDSPLRSANISWKKLEPFVETNGNDSIYGFKLYRGDVFMDFFTETSDELELWLLKLSKVCIAIDIHDDFIFDRVIGKGSYAEVYLSKSNEDGKSYAIKSINKQ
mmetsp:Transcript_23399/g.3839  ORF Transcript_23399/g.3839 Transcript_23399/m.3839 type:complete len:126 (-) Transcript_23399:1011-1388(-)